MRDTEVVANVTLCLGIHFFLPISMKIHMQKNSRKKKKNPTMKKQQ